MLLNALFLSQNTRSLFHFTSLAFKKDYFLHNLLRIEIYVYIFTLFKTNSKNLCAMCVFFFKLCT